MAQYCVKKQLEMLTYDYVELGFGSMRRSTSCVHAVVRFLATFCLVLHSFENFQTRI